jgi:hypothetical protein
MTSAVSTTRPDLDGAAPRPSPDIWQAAAPSVLDFALAFRAPVPAAVAFEFELLDEADRRAAVAGAEGFIARARAATGIVPNPLIYLRLRLWSRER